MTSASLVRITFATVFVSLMALGASSCSLRPTDRSGLPPTTTGSIAQPNSRYIKQTPDKSAVIVFVHGIIGDSTTTWTDQNGTYWPSLLANDPFFSAYDVYVYEYPSRFFGRNLSIDEVSENMRLLFEADEVSDYQEIIFVAHSMGGLVTRAYLNKNRNVADHVRLAYFFSTPTTGSELASLGSLISKNPQLAKMRPMQSWDYLADLQRQWLNINYDVPSFCAYETLTTYGVSVVTQASASNLCNRRLDPIEGNHLTIVKPASERDAAYLALKAAVRQTPGKLECKDSADRLVIRMNDDIKKENYENALRTADLIKSCYGRVFDAYRGAGEIHFYRREFFEASKEFREALEIDPESISGKMNLASALLEMGNISEARNVLEDARTESPDWYYEMGRAELYAGNYRTAIERFGSVRDDLYDGRPRILEAAAYAGLAEEAINDQEREKYQGKAREALQRGLETDAARRYPWRELFEGTYRDKREGFEKPRELLTSIFGEDLRAYVK